jgi:hypothetical protein
MADKKKIKNIKDGTGSGDGATITVVDLNPPRTTTPGTSATATAPDETFKHFGHKAMCFNVGDILNTESISVPGVATPIIVTARRIQRGTVLATADNTTGTIEENKSKKVINFFQPYLKEIGIVSGTEVKYDLVPDSSTGLEIAVNVEIQP